MQPTMGLDGHFGGGAAVLVRPAYGLRVVRGFEIGAELGYWLSTTDDRALYVLIPSLALRPYIALGAADSGELGIQFKGGVATAWIHDASGSWFGPGFSVGPDLRIWTSPSVGVQTGIEFFASYGHNAGDPRVRDPYLAERGRVLALAAWFGVVARF